MSSATKNDSLNGATNGEVTLVAMSCAPFGNFCSSGAATNVNSSPWKYAQGMNAMPTAMRQRMSRLRSSSRCEMSVPSVSFSASSVMEPSMRVAP